LPDEVHNEAYKDYLGGHDLLCTRYKITAAAAKAVQKRTATKHINTVLQKAMLVTIEKEVKLEHLLDIPEVVENEQKFGVISVEESNLLVMCFIDSKKSIDIFIESLMSVDASDFLTSSITTMAILHRSASNKCIQNKTHVTHLGISARLTAVTLTEIGNVNTVAKTLVESSMMSSRILTPRGASIVM